MGVAFKDSLCGLISGDGPEPGFRITTDGGRTFVKAGTPVDITPSFVTYIPGTRGGYVATSWDLYGWMPGSAYTYDNGTTWIPIDRTNHGRAVFLSPSFGWSAGEDDSLNEWRGESLPPAATLGISRSSLDFRNVHPGSSSDTLRVLAQNWGSTQVIISSFRWNRPEFLVAGPLPVLIPVSGDYEIRLVFQPGTAGMVVEDTITLTSNDEKHPVIALPLRGRGSGTVTPAKPGQMYAIAATRTETKLYGIDRRTGAAALLSDLSPDPPSEISGFAIRPAEEVMYAGLSNEITTTLYRVSPEFGDVEVAGTIPIGRVTTMAFSPGDTLYLADQSGRLFRTKGIGTDTVCIGSTGIVFTGLAFSPATRVLWGCAHDTLYTIDASSGTASLIGSSGGALPSTIAFGPLGTLYGTFGSALVMLDHTSGGSTLIGMTGIPGINGIVMRTDATTETEESPTSPPGVSQLLQNYPNPFNPATVIGYQLATACHVRLVIYDLLGRELSTLVNQWEPAGRHEVRLAANGLASGVYFYRLTAGDFVQARKLSLLR